MTFKERYHSETKWVVQVAILELYHLAKCNKYKDWTQSKTAEYFDISLASVNENLRLADALHSNIPIESLSRNMALRIVRYGPINVGAK